MSEIPVGTLSATLNFAQMCCCVMTVGSGAAPVAAVAVAAAAAGTLLSCVLRPTTLRACGTTSDGDAASCWRWACETRFCCCCFLR